MNQRSTHLEFNLGRETGAFGLVIGGFWITVTIVLVVHFGFPSSWKSLYLIPILYPAIAMMAAHTRVQIDPIKRRIKVYTWIPLFKLGLWRSLDGHEDLFILKRKLSTGKNGHISGQEIGSLEGDWHEYEICLAKPHHFTPYLLYRSEDQEEVYRIVRDLVEQLGCEWVEFNPGRKNRRKVIQRPATSAESIE
ncbi:hypothetical protein [Pontibacter sp. G13]|uniref:hypothetical protein n=1 Tax=Pontibacter sp. G13 TaxID=3074898 RepID=UPI0028896C94|nr:hypothetical protein [Pontibacter sp. G13]WNJ19707.1 hypothetical protein RJD25_04425 [Pontibacter sp. G13]